MSKNAGNLDATALTQGSSPKTDDSKGDEKSHRFPVIGVGASAGGLESIERFFRNIDDKCGAAFVVIQHLSPDFKSFMSEILSKKTELQVITATDGMPVHPNVIYLMPPRMNMVIQDNILLLSNIERTRIPNKPIDLFFNSLAQDVGEHATAVVLSGTGSDGALGIRSIYDAGGSVFVESMQSAKFDGMPSAALAVGVHDGEGEPEDIAAQIFGGVFNDDPEQGQALARELAGDRERIRIFKAIESRYGVDFARYKIATVNRRIDRRMTVLGLSGIDQYWTHIQSNAQELTTLYYEMLIGVTQFFRDPEAYERLKSQITAIVEKKLPGEEVRVWSAGCASGEEIYSLSILFMEEVKRTKKDLKLKVFATDIDDEILAKAAAGVYSKGQISSLPEQWRGVYFKAQGEDYKVTAALRAAVVFARHNVMNDPPFTKLDMIACRNLLIYLDNKMQKQVLSLFYFSLNPDGVLFLGPSESLGKYEAGYDTIDTKWKIFSKSSSSLPTAGSMGKKPQVEREFPVLATAKLSSGGRSDVSAKFNTDEAYQALLDQYVPPSVLSDENQNLLHVYGELPFKLSFKPGKVSNNLRSFLDEGLCTAISVCIQRAKRDQIAVEYTQFVLNDGDQQRMVDFKVTPVISKKRERVGFFLISFVDHASDVDGLGGSRVVVDKAIDLEQVSVLEEELQNTKEHLQATIEELETTNEELQSTNEELLASNEELQSTNEELHSVNEELYSVNAEYQTKIAELNQLSMDEEHLFRSTGVGTIFVDRNLRIRKFTPAAAELFNLLTHDLGRPFDHVTHTFESVNFSELMQIVLASDEILETEVRTRSGEPHIAKIVPYRNEQNDVDGVVISFVSVRAIQDAERRYREIFHSSPVGVLGINLKQEVVSVNPSFLSLSGFQLVELKGKKLSMLLTEEGQEQLDKMFVYLSADDSSGTLGYLSVDLLSRGGDLIPVEISATPINTDDGILVHLHVVDMTERQSQLATVESHRDALEDEVRARTRELERRTREYEDLYENAPAMYGSVDAETSRIMKCNDRLVRATGYSKVELLNMTVMDLYHPVCLTDAQVAFQQFKATGHVKSKQLVIKTKNGAELPVLLNVDAVRNETGKITRSRSTWVDVSDVTALQNENLTFLLATQGSAIGIFDWNLETDVQQWSEKFCELLGYTDNEPPLSRRLLDAVHPKHKKELTKHLQGHFDEQEPFSIEVPLRRAAGEYGWFRLQGEAVRDASGKAQRMVGSVQDVHEIRQAQDELKRREIELQRVNQELTRSNDDLDRFAYIVSHDLKAPLRDISNLGVFLRQDLKKHLAGGDSSNEKIRHHLERLDRQTRRMGGLIKGVLDYSRLEKTDNPIEAVDVGELLRDISADYQIDTTGQMVLPDNLPTLQTDAIRLQQVFGNLVSNAMKYHPQPDKARIDIHCKQQGDYFRFEVVDNGPGIEEKFQRGIFEMFQTLRPRDETESTGVGLSLVKRIVETGGGEVGVSSNPGEGSSFYFTWPEQWPHVDDHLDDSADDLSATVEHSD
ncbi:MAG: CheR family methyltransferase [Lysobacterales bacterium]